MGTGWVGWWADVGVEGCVEGWIGGVGGSTDRRVGFTPHSTTHYHPTVYHLSLSLGQVAALESAVDACADDSACLQASKYVSTE